MNSYSTRYTTLLDDATDTSFSNDTQLLGFLVRIHSLERREHFSEGITTSGVTVGNSSTDGFVQFLPSIVGDDSYTLQNVNGVLSLVRNHSVDGVVSVGNVSSSGVTLASGVTLSSLQQSSDSNDTTELVPILVDQTGKLYRGHSLFQTIAQLQQRLQTLENAGSIQVEERLSQAELLIQKIRTRYNALNLESSKI